MNNEPVALTQGDILGILQDANSVPCGQPIFNSSEEYNKLKAIIESAIRYTQPAKTLTDAFIYENHVGYLSPSNDFYAPDYPTWKQDGFTPIYKEPVAKTLTDEEIEYLLRESIWALGLNTDWTEDENWNDAITVFKSILRKAQEK